MKQELKTVYIPATVIDRLDYDYLGYAKKIVFPEQLITFTKEEYNKHIQDVIKDSLNTAADYADTEFCGNMYDPEDNTKCINRESIINTFEETFKKYKL